MQRFYLLLALLIAFSGPLTAQPSDHAWLETSKLKVRVNADGRIFCDDEKGAFLVPHGDSMTTLMRGAALWFGGIDPGDNLHISSQSLDPELTDMMGGLRGIPNSARVWKVTGAEIKTHWTDYWDNGVIDDPIPSIFAWPARGNSFFSAYNGMQWPDSMLRRPFSDDGNGLYEPHLGEFPMLNVRYLDTEWQMPSEMACFAFHTDAPHLLSGSSRPFPVQVWGTVFVFDCPENDLLSRSVFVHYEWENVGPDIMDSVHVSMLNDWDIGEAGDDYQGSLPTHSAHFAYNADSLDGVWGGQAPLFFLDELNPPNHIVYNNPWFDEYYEYPRRGNMMPYHYNDPNVPAGMRGASAPNEFYNYMTGSWRDGTPLTAVRLGYNPWLPNEPRATTAFPGHPDVPGAWTELNEQNPLGDRAALINYNTGLMRPGWRNSMTLQYAYQPWTPGTLTERMEGWKAEREYLSERMFCCIDFFDDPRPPIGCEFSLPPRKTPSPWSIFPNPANEVIKVWNSDTLLKKMLLYDALGRLCGIGQFMGLYSEVSVQHLPAGMYFLHLVGEDGTQKTAKVMVAHGVE